nr:Chain A, Sensory rhodopsin II [Natronomonas pharaonis]
MVGLTTLFWLGAIGMLVGTLAFAWAGRDAGSGERRYYVTLVGISGIAAVAYAVMALGVGWVPVAERTVFVPRYIDWILTTPLIVYFLGLLAGLDSREFGIVITLNTVVMLAGFAGAMVPGIERYALFGMGAVAFIGLVYYLVGPMTESASQRSSGIKSLYVRLRNLTVVLWAIYPFIWLLGPPGVALLTPTVDVALIVYLDLVTKVGFGFIALDAAATLRAEHGESLAGVDTDTPAVADLEHHHHHH